MGFTQLFFHLHFEFSAYFYRLTPLNRDLRIPTVMMRRILRSYDSDDSNDWLGPLGIILG
jgi:hypothetical protein